MNGFNHMADTRVCGPYDTLTENTTNHGVYISHELYERMRSSIAIQLEHNIKLNQDLVKAKLEISRKDQDLKHLNLKHEELIHLKEKYKRDIDNARIWQKQEDVKTYEGIKKENEVLKKKLRIQGLFIKSVKEWLNGSVEDFNSALERLRKSN